MSLQYDGLIRKRSSIDRSYIPGTTVLTFIKYIFVVLCVLLLQPIERTEKFFAPLKINRKLEEQLPFKFKSREASNVEPRDVLESQRVAVIKQPNEAKLAGLMKMFKQVHEVRVKKQHEAHVKQATKHRREMEKIEGKRLEKSKEMRKQVYRRLGKQEKRKTKWSQDKDD